MNTSMFSSSNISGLIIEILCIIAASTLECKWPIDSHNEGSRHYLACCECSFPVMSYWWAEHIWANKNFKITASGKNVLLLIVIYYTSFLAEVGQLTGHPQPTHMYVCNCKRWQSYQPTTYKAAKWKRSATVQRQSNPWEWVRCHHDQPCRDWLATYIDGCCISSFSIFMKLKKYLEQICVNS